MRTLEKVAARGGGRARSIRPELERREAKRFDPSVLPAMLRPSDVLTMQRRVGNSAVTGYLAQSRVSVQREVDEEEEQVTETELPETTEDFTEPMPKRSAWSKVADQAKSYGGGVKEVFNIAGFGRIGAGFRAGRRQVNRGGASASTLARGFYRAAKDERGIPITDAAEIPQFGAGYVAGRATRAAIDGPTQLWNLVADVIGNPKALWRRIASRFRKGAGAVNFG